MRRQERAALVATVVMGVLSTVGCASVVGAPSTPAGGPTATYPLSGADIAGAINLCTSEATNGQIGGSLNFYLNDVVQLSTWSGVTAAAQCEVSVDGTPPAVTPVSPITGIAYGLLFASGDLAPLAEFFARPEPSWARVPCPSGGPVTQYLMVLNDGRWMIPRAPYLSGPCFPSLPTNAQLVPAAFVPYVP